ncbi:stress response translation initiation inhibitor YciH [Marinimicrobium sp. ABcell2]|uniref:stress response translation initiation inhibitor YciH n=1 Tax=Marinimicrobium sp. ABcell2 TaxID=3069751 RepID=UPI0027B494D0|nr:stress response translation initiation inhibitor YciH [Marinimicrobium sp. ABcell2]MDQ2075343.1 stress response translation initiation inhibitor YciH [Marinimicrobium sp. ABcell2]
MSRNSRLVYSTDKGRIKSESTPADAAPVGDGIVRLRRETKGRKGKGVTLVDGVPESADKLKTLAKELKQLCGTGGSVKAGVIEIQGDQRERLKPALEAKGYTVKLAGG